MSVQRLRRKKDRSSSSSALETCVRGHVPSGAGQSPTSWCTQTSPCRLRNSATLKAHASSRRTSRFAEAARSEASSE
eukprot:2065165-Alexandrium_andersonii.AAC.1